VSEAVAAAAGDGDDDDELMMACGQCVLSQRCIWVG